MKPVPTQMLSFTLAALMIAGSTLAATRAPAGASSHREAPLISNDAQADTTDVYAFVSPERQDSVTLIGSWIPLESPEGGPVYGHMATGARVEEP